jgi:hypothetical protein
MCRALDEWRFWNGARPDSAVLSGMRQPIKATREDFYGDPSDPKRQVSRRCVSFLFLLGVVFPRETGAV